MTIEEQFKQYFPKGTLLCFNYPDVSGEFQYPSGLSIKIELDSDIQVWSVLNFEDHFQDVAIVCNSLDISYLLIPELVKLTVNSIKNGRIGKGNLIMEGVEFNSQQLGFSGAVYIFANEILPSKSDIEKHFAGHNLRVKFRDKAYFENEFESRKPDVFICHSFKDKKSIARPLYEALETRNLKVWYDETSLKLGDSFSEKLQEGIRNCRFGIIIFSKNFLANEKWAKYELNSFTAKEIIEKRKVIIPIWHKVGEREVSEKSYWLAEKFAATDTKNIKALAERIYNQIKL